MTEAKSGIISILGDSPRTRLLEYLMEFPKDKFTPGELVEAVGMSRTTAFKQINELLALNMIKKDGTHRKSSLFQINSDNLRVQLIQKLVSLRSMEIANEELKNDKTTSLLIAQAQVQRLEEHKKLLQLQLQTTRKTLREIPVQLMNKNKF